jgi:hypothetical protein
MNQDRWGKNIPRLHPSLSWTRFDHLERVRRVRSPLHDSRVSCWCLRSCGSSAGECHAGEMSQRSQYEDDKDIVAVKARPASADVGAPLLDTPV